MSGGQDGLGGLPLGEWRQFAKERRGIEKSIAANLRTVARSNGWKTIANYTYQVRGDWFAYVNWRVSDQRNTILLRLRVKPMELDHVFWDILWPSENKNLKLSLRANGGWAMHPPALFEEEINDEGELPETTSDRIFSWIGSSIATSLERFSISDLTQLIENDIDWQNRREFCSELICSYILSGRIEDARRLAKTCVMYGQALDHIVGGKSFGALALDWLDAKKPRDPWKRATGALQRLFVLPGNSLKQ